ncbi:MAG: DUF1376 domain-containing protein [Planctomycetota bacterium]
MNFYAHHLGDYARNTRHLSMVEHGAYRLLIDLYYVREAPLPLEEPALFRLVCARTDDEKLAVTTILDEFFVRTEDGWRHTRCDEEIAKGLEKQTKARASASARWDANAMRTHSERIANAMPTQCEGNAPNPNPNPNPNIKDEETTSLGDLPAADPPSATVIEIKKPKREPPGVPLFPFEELIGLYHQRLPMCPRVQLLTEQRRKFAAARWKAWAAMDGWESQEQGLGEWAAFFDVVAKSKFLTGRAQGHNNDRPPFVADFDWLMRPTNFQKVFEGRYSDQRLAR